MGEGEGEGFREGQYWTRRWEVGLQMGEEQRGHTTMQWNLVKKQQQILKILLLLSNTLNLTLIWTSAPTVHLFSVTCLEWLARSAILNFFSTPSGCMVSGLSEYTEWHSKADSVLALKCAPSTWTLQKPDTTSRGMWKPQKSMAQAVTVGGSHTSTCPCIRWALSCWAALKIFLWCPSRFTPRFWTSLKEKADEPQSLVKHLSFMCVNWFSEGQIWWVCISP